MTDRTSSHPDAVPPVGEPPPRGTARPTDELVGLTISAAAELIADRRLSPVELVEAHLRRIGEANPVLSAYLTVCEEPARLAAARAAEEIAAGRERGPLHGIPYGVKDTYLTRGVATTAASRLFAGCVPDTSATVVDRLDGCGAVLLGKHNTWELGTGTGEVADDLPYPVARSPWSLSHYTGGSSTGTAAAVAAGLAMFGMASDTGASIRAPSAANGVVGVKPTYGRVSRAGIIPNTSSFDTPGPIACTVADAALVLEAVAGPDPADPTSAGRSVPRFSADLRSGVDGLTIGLARRFGDGPPLDLDEEVGAALEGVVDELTGAGARIVECALPYPMADYRRIMRIVGGSESLAYHLDHLRHRRREMGAAVRDKFLGALGITAVELLNAQRLRREMAAATDAVVSGFDAVLAPGPVRTVPRLDDPEAVVAYVMGATTVWCNVSGHPAVAIPAGFDRAGLPIGVQIVGRYWDEQSILAVAAAHEEATGWGERRPVMSGDPVSPRPRHPAGTAQRLAVDDAAAIAERLGIADVDDELVERIAALAGDTRAAAAELSHDLPWSLEPASIFVVPGK